jgi:HKD family nuclease
MKVEAFFNRGLATLEREFRDAAGSATQIDLASAFLTPDGLRRLEAILDLEDWPSVRILVGLYQHFTPPEVIVRLSYLQRRHPGRFSARIAKNQRFHWKYFCFGKSNFARAYVGSANLTTDGFTASGEIFVRLKGRRTEHAIRSVRAEFERIWTHHAQRITRELIEVYKSNYRPPKMKPPNNTLASFLEKPERSSLPTGLISKPRLIFVSDEVSKDVAKSIRQETDWYSRNWGYTVFPNKSSYEKARDARVLLNVQEWRSDKDYLIEFCGVREYLDSIETSDGKYFVAHSKLRKSWSRRFSTIKSELRQLGLTRKKLASDRYLNRKQMLGLARLMHAEPSDLN